VFISILFSFFEWIFWCARDFLKCTAYLWNRCSNNNFKKSKKEKKHTQKSCMLTDFIWHLKIVIDRLNAITCWSSFTVGRRGWTDQEVIRIRKSKKDRQQNGQKKKDKKTNNDLQNITHKTKDRVTRTLLITGVNSGAPLVPDLGYSWSKKLDTWQ
jgi:hypothetical protein